MKIFEELIGKTIKEININKGFNDIEEIEFVTTCGNIYKMFHEFECCEEVFIEDICGDLEDLLYSPLLTAEMVSNKDLESYASTTYTFYKFATINGYVDIRWFGESNGAYSEEVSFY